MHQLLRHAVITALTSGVAVLGAGAASAHVTVSAPGAQQGSYSVLTFNVPNESATAGTTKLTVTLPNLKAARTEPVPGWTATVTTNADKEATAVTWTANPGVQIGATEFQRFAISAGPLPKTASVSFPAAQTYSDGTVVNWSEPMTAGGGEPDHPAPMLMLGTSSTSGHHAGHDMQVSAAPEPEPSTDDNTARWLGRIGIGVGVIALALGAGLAIRARRS